MIIPNNITSLGDEAFANCSSLASIYFQGNAPGLGLDVFANDTGIGYYFTGTTGWDSTLGGLSVTNIGLDYSMNGGAITITGYTGASPFVPIPNTINGVPITAIGDSAFYGNSTLGTLIIPAGVTSIGNEAFANCANINSVTIPANVTSLGNEAFQNCSSLISIYFQGNAPATGADVFAGDNASVFYPNGTSGWGPTLGGLWAVNLNLVYATNNGAITITGWLGGGGTLTIPGAIARYPVNAIGSYAFSTYGPTNVTIPGSISNIADYAFAYSWLNSIVIPATVVSIGHSVFYYSAYLTSAQINNDIMGNSEFIACAALTNVTFAYGITNIPQDAFYGCSSLRNVAIPDSVTTIGSDAFQDCGLTSLSIPNSVSSIGVQAFASTPLTNVFIGSGVTNIASDAFVECGLLSKIYFEGNAPGPGNNSSVFAGDHLALYYLPGTLGWGASFDGIPTTKWYLSNPLILNFESNFGIRTNRFNFTVSWATNIPVVVLASTNLAASAWQPIATNLLSTGSFNFTDPQWTNYPSRYYRVGSQ